MTTTNKTEISDMKTSISLLQKDIENFEKYFEKLDITVVKITELTSNMSRMITLHEERIGVQAKDDNDLRQLIENRRKETEQGFFSIERKIDSNFRDVSKKIEDANQKIWKLDLKRASMVGAIIVVAFIVGPLLNGFVQAYFKHLFYN